MSTQSTHMNDQLRKAIGKLVRGLEKRDREQHERRRHHRFHFGVMIEVCLKSSDDSYQTLCEAWAVDLSIGGLGFMTEQRFKSGDLVFVSFEKLIGKPCYVPVTIRGSAPLIGNVQQVHCQFAYMDED